MRLWRKRVRRYEPTLTITGMLEGSQVIRVSRPGVYMVSGQSVMRGDDGKYVLRYARQQVTVDAAEVTVVGLTAGEAK